MCWLSFYYIRQFCSILFSFFFIVYSSYFVEYVWIESDTHCLHSPRVRFVRVFHGEDIHVFFLHSIVSMICMGECTMWIGDSFAIKIVPVFHKTTHPTSSIHKYNFDKWFFVGMEIIWDSESILIEKIVNKFRFTMWIHRIGICLSIYSYDFGICNLRLIFIRKIVDPHRYRHYIWINFIDHRRWRTTYITFLLWSNFSSVRLC